MARRLILQPPIEVTAPTIQEVRFAAPTTGAKTALFWVNVHKNTMGAGTARLDILGASSLTLLDTGASSSFWITVLGGSTLSITAGSVGAFSIAAPILPDFVRWQMTSNSNVLQFEIIADLDDT